MWVQQFSELLFQGSKCMHATLISVSGQTGLLASPEWWRKGSKQMGEEGWLPMSCFSFWVSCWGADLVCTCTVINILCMAQNRVLEYRVHDCCITKWRNLAVSSSAVTLFTETSLQAAVAAGWFGKLAGVILGFRCQLVTLFSEDTTSILAETLPVYIY